MISHRSSKYIDYYSCEGILSSSGSVSCICFSSSPETRVSRAGNFGQLLIESGQPVKNFKFEATDNKLNSSRGRGLLNIVIVGGATLPLQMTTFPQSDRQKDARISLGV